MVSSKPCVGRSPRTNISFFLLSVCTGELFSTTKIITFYPSQNLDVKKVNEN